MMESMQHYGSCTDDVDIVFHEDELEDSNLELYHANENISRRQFRNLTEIERHEIYEALLERSMHRRLKGNTTTRVAEMFQVSRC
jgi:hypothetical protein